MPQCASCPVTLGTCPGTYHPPVCLDVANGLPGRASQLIAVAAILAGAGDLDDQPAEAWSTPEVRADLCGWADPSSPCGCGGPAAPPRICTRPDRPREVRRPYCLECAAGADWTDGPDPAPIDQPG